MTMRHLILGWLGLLVLGTIEFGCSYIPFSPSFRPLLLVPSLCMVAVVGIVFMNVRTGPATIRIFAIAGLFWLTILLGLGMMDPLTRAVYQITG